MVEAIRPQGRSTTAYGRVGRWSSSLWPAWSGSPVQALPARLVVFVYLGSESPSQLEALDVAPRVASNADDVIAGRGLASSRCETFGRPRRPEYVGSAPARFHDERFVPTACRSRH